VLEERGHEVVAISRSKGIDVITGEGLADALTGVDGIVDVATGPSPEQDAATEFFVTASGNLHSAGQRAGVRRMVVVSIVGVDRFTGGYSAAKLAHEAAAQAGPIPVRILRASQFYEFVEQLLAWGRQGDVAYVQEMRTQPIAARTVAEALVDLVTDPSATPGPILDIAGPREESMVDMATRFAARRGDPVRVEGVTDPSDPDGALYLSGALLPGPDATLAGPTFADWLDAL
jgi:uncharacterized protein YbjT (DUF2867 family)